MYGWVGKILKFDLTSEKISEIPTSNYVPKFLGGWGIMAKIAWDEISSEVRAFDSDNKLMFMTGPLTGTLAPGSCRTEIAAISSHTYPTEDYVRSGFGGHWGPELKYAGYDGVIFQGKASKPVWVWINNGSVEIRDARELWGLDTYQIQEAIWRELGSDRVQIACIGPAGENLIRFAVISHGNGHAAGTGGMGYVMGSKNLKAIAVKGTGGIDIAKPDEFYKYSLYLQRLIYRPETRTPTGLDQIGIHRLGTGGSTNKSLKEYLKRKTVKAAACFRCPIACRPYFSIGDSIKRGVSNSCYALHRDIMWDLEKHGRYTNHHIKSTAITDDLGIDIHEVTRIIKWLKGCYRSGVLTEEETDISLENLGDYECIEKLNTKIAYREGFGDFLAEGVLRASDALGKIGREFIDNSNRGFDTDFVPRDWPTTAIATAMQSSRRYHMYNTWANRIGRKNPGYIDSGRAWLSVDEWLSVVRDLFHDEDVIDHTGNAYYHPSKARLTKWLEDYRTITLGCMILCDWIYPMWWSWYSNKPNRRGFSPEAEAKMFSLITGVEMNVDEMLKVGERVINLERAIMIREGRRREDDTLSDVFLSEQKEFPVPNSDGVFVPQTRKIDVNKFEELKDHYYMERGWDLETGIPTRQKLEDLELKDVANSLWPRACVS